MSSSKDENRLMAKDPSNRFRVIPTTLGGLIAGYLPVNDVLKVMRLSITTHNLFKPNLYAKKARACVVQGNVEVLMFIAKNHPEALFQKGMIIDPRGRVFFNASAFQLIYFLCDVDMKNQVMAMIPPATCDEERQTQMAELGHGGADLVKLGRNLGRNPMVMSGNEFHELTEYKETFTLSFSGAEQEVIFPLLENIDGIIYYQDEHQEVHLYYANRNSQHIMPLTPNITSEEDQKSFTAFKALFATMELNSSRRSTNAEHQLIQKLFLYRLQRQGLHYADHGVQYQDSRTPFRLINAYRTCIRFYTEEKPYESREKKEKYWCEGVGNAQGEEMWLLQRICEERRPFYPLPTDFNGFKRGFTFYNWISCEKESVVVAGRIITELGSHFALCKARSDAVCTELPSFEGIGADLVAVCWLVEDAKAHINQSLLESEQVLQTTNSRQV